ncbi:MAG: hypothetical protein HYX26_09820 [Acidobacteriales bacterium]|nr:hypothetical protein [Terriglobales bacterium]
MRFKPLPILLLLLTAGAAHAGGKKANAAPPLTRETRYQLIRLMTADYAWAKAPFPLGDKGLVIKPDGKLSPAPDELGALILKRGKAAKPGQRVQISKIEITGNQIKFEINGGGVKKKKWYERIQVSGGSGQSVSAGQEPNQMAKGSYLTVEFKDYVPEMTLAELQKILEPALDFSVKSAAQAYTETREDGARSEARGARGTVGGEGGTGAGGEACGCAHAAASRRTGSAA